MRGCLAMTILVFLVPNLSVRGDHPLTPLTPPPNPQLGHYDCSTRGSPARQDDRQEGAI